jgi:hypothetical protein
MSTTANKGDRSSLASVEAWENEGGAIAAACEIDGITERGEYVCREHHEYETRIP